MSKTTNLPATVDAIPLATATQDPREASTFSLVSVLMNTGTELMQRILTEAMKADPKLAERAAELAAEGDRFGLVVVPPRDNRLDGSVTLVATTGDVSDPMLAVGALRFEVDQFGSLQ